MWHPVLYTVKPKSWAFHPNFYRETLDPPPAGVVWPDLENNSELLQGWTLNEPRSRIIDAYFIMVPLRKRSQLNDQVWHSRTQLAAT